MYYEKADFEVLDRCVDLANQRSVKPAQIALAWMLHKPGITAPIIGASKMHQVEEAVAATEIELSPGEIKRLEEPYVPHRILGHAAAPDIRSQLYGSEPTCPRRRPRRSGGP